MLASARFQISGPCWMEMEYKCMHTSDRSSSRNSGLRQSLMYKIYINPDPRVAYLILMDLEVDRIAVLEEILAVFQHLNEGLKFKPI